MKKANIFPSGKPAGSFLLKILFCSLTSAFAAEALWRIWRDLDIVFNMSADTLQVYLSHFTFSHIVLAFGGFLVIYYILFRFGTAAADFIYRHRFLLAAIALILLTALNLSGSSIHMWADYTSSSADGVLLGMARDIRTDEWSVNTPYAFAQAQADFPYFSEIIRGDTTDTFIVYGQPVWDLAVLFRPFHWGYLLFGASRGLSFFWCARLLALILVSFETGMLLTGKRRCLSLGFSILVSFSSLIQWWFAINGLVEMLVFGFGAVLLANAYMNTESYRKRILFTLAAAECCVAYVLCFYPAWMVPLAWFLGGMLLWLIFSNRKNFRFCFRKDLPILLSFLVILILCLGYVVFKSGDAISLTLGTVYPGQRKDTATLDWRSLFRWMTGLFTTTHFKISSTNQVSISSFFSLFPLGLLLSLYAMIRRKKADSLSLILTAVSALLFLYVFVGFPDWLNNLTLLRFSTPTRTLPIFMLGQVLLLFRGAALLGEQPLPLRAAVPFAVLFALILAKLGINAFPEFYDEHYMYTALRISIGAMTLLFLAMPGRKRIQGAFLICTAAIGFFCGVLVNPVQQGTEELTDSIEAQAIAEIVDSDPDALWIADTDTFMERNLPIAVGARTINCTNVYPDLERWYLLDPDHSDEDIYNRYAHIDVKISSKKTRFRSGEAIDQFRLRLNVDDLSVLDVDYIYTDRNLTSLSTENTRLTLVAECGEHFIYHVE